MTAGSKARRRKHGRRGAAVLARQATIEGARRGEQTAILIDDLSLNPRWRNPPVALQRVLAELGSFHEGSPRSRGRPATEDDEIGPRTRAAETRWARERERERETPRGTRNPTLGTLEPDGQLGHEEIDLRVGGCRIIINWPFSRVEGLAAIRLCVPSCSSVRTRPRSLLAFRPNRRRCAIRVRDPRTVNE